MLEFSRRGLIGGAAAMGAVGLTGAAAPGGLIDIHHHYASPGFIKKITDLKTGQVPLLNWTVGKSLEEMDRGGVQTAVISTSEPGVWYGDKVEARAMAREANEYGTRLCADHPGRFRFFAMLPLPDVEGSLAEIAYAFDTLKASGICLITSFDGKYLGDPAFAPVMAELNRRKAIVYTHPTRAPCCRGVIPGVPDTAIELVVDSTRTIASILCSGTAARNPDIRFIFSHGGGTMPFILSRFQGLAARPEFKPFMPNGVEPELAKFWYDTAQATTPGTLLALTKLIPTSQILYGTDYPFVTPKATADALRAFFSPADFERIGRGNAARLLGL